MIKAGGGTIRSEIRELINSFWNEEDDKTDYVNYQSISLLFTSHKILYNILLYWLTSHTAEIIGAHQSGVLRHRLTADIYSAFIRYLRKK
jgi:hypothetical protein